MERSEMLAGAFQAMRILAAIVVATLFSVSMVFTLGYTSSFIYLIGYENQLLPLFEGIIIGTIIFTASGALISRFSPLVTAISAVVGGILFAAVVLILHATSLVVPNGLLLLCAILITASFMPVTSFSLRATGVHGRFAKASVAAATAVIGVLSIAIIAIIYEKSGQSDLAFITSTLSYSTIFVLGISLLALLLAAQRHQK